MFNTQTYRTMHVYNLTSNRTGRPVANQFCILGEDGTRYFQSYSSIICKISPSGEITLDEYYWNYSKTTTKYLREFLGMNGGQIQTNIEAGIFKMSNLNK